MFHVKKILFISHCPHHPQIGRYPSRLPALTLCLFMPLVRDFVFLLARLGGGGLLLDIQLDVPEGNGDIGEHPLCCWSC